MNANLEHAKKQFVALLQKPFQPYVPAPETDLRSPIEKLVADLIPQYEKSLYQHMNSFETGHAPLPKQIELSAGFDRDIEQTHDGLRNEMFRQYFAAHGLKFVSWRILRAPGGACQRIVLESPS